MNETELAALYKKWIAQVIDEATDLRLLKIAYWFVNGLFSGSEVKGA